MAAVRVYGVLQHSTFTLSIIFFFLSPLSSSLGASYPFSFCLAEDQSPGPFPGGGSRRGEASWRCPRPRCVQTWEPMGLAPPQDWTRSPREHQKDWLSHIPSDNCREIDGSHLEHTRSEDISLDNRKLCCRTEEVGKQSKWGSFLVLEVS